MLFIVLQVYTICRARPKIRIMAPMKIVFTCLILFTTVCVGFAQPNEPLYVIDTVAGGGQHLSAIFRIDGYRMHGQVLG